MISQDTFDEFFDEGNRKLYDVMPKDARITGFKRWAEANNAILLRYWPNSPEEMSARHYTWLNIWCDLCNAAETFLNEPAQ